MEQSYKWDAAQTPKDDRARSQSHAGTSGGIVWVVQLAKSSAPGDVFLLKLCHLTFQYVLQCDGEACYAQCLATRPQAEQTNNTKTADGSPLCVCVCVCVPALAEYTLGFPHMLTNLLCKTSLGAYSPTLGYTRLLLFLVSARAKIPAYINNIMDVPQGKVGTDKGTLASWCRLALFSNDRQLATPTSDNELPLVDSNALIIELFELREGHRQKASRYSYIHRKQG
eukprot:1160777-Pelagomonas_calceolata.AAC.6